MVIPPELQRRLDAAIEEVKHGLSTDPEFRRKFFEGLDHPWD